MQKVYKYTFLLLCGGISVIITLLGEVQKTAKEIPILSGF
jgi:hypothetical protein